MSRKASTSQFTLFGDPDKPPALTEADVIAAAAGCAYPTAESLISRYGSLSDVISAAELEDQAIPKATRRRLVAIRAAVRMLAREAVLNRPILSSWDKVIDYCRISLAHLPTEEFHVLFLDRKNALIADETMGRGTVDHCPVYPREVARRALLLNCSAILMVHNHPSGDPAPSKADIEMTRSVERAVQALGIVLHDHVVIGRGGHTSFKTLGLL